MTIRTAGVVAEWYTRLAGDCQGGGVKGREFRLAPPGSFVGSGCITSLGGRDVAQGHALPYFHYRVPVLRALPAEDVAQRMAMPAPRCTCETCGAHHGPHRQARGRAGGNERTRGLRTGATAREAMRLRRG